MSNHDTTRLLCFILNIFIIIEYSGWKIMKKTKIGGYPHQIFQNLNKNSKNIKKLRFVSKDELLTPSELGVISILRIYFFCKKK